MIRISHEAFRVLVLAATFFVAAPASGVLFNGGVLYVIDDDTYSDDRVEVEDSPEGATTTVRIIDPAQVGGGFLASLLGSISAEALNGGRAVVQIEGGTIEFSVSIGANSDAAISGGSVGTDLIGRVAPCRRQRRTRHRDHHGGSAGWSNLARP